MIFFVTYCNGIIIYRLIKKYNIDINEVFLAVLSHNLGLDYLLLYKNFETDSIARVFCLSYLEFLDDCLIVNVQNL